MNAVLVEYANPIRVISKDSKPEIPGWACAGMPTHWYAAMRMAWAHDYTGQEQLEYKLWHIAVKKAIRFGWRVPRGQERLRKMARLAIHELMDPARYKKPDSWMLRIAAIGCKKTQWFSLWQERYEMIFTELNDWVNRAYRYLKVKLCRGNNE